MSRVPALYEPLIERDLEAIEPAIREFRRGASSDELCVALARFAILAFAPSQHSKHAMIAVLSTHDLRDDLGEHYDAMLVECARYVAESRQPWSEPPITDPPFVARDAPRDLDELRAAIASRDRLRGERWLAARLGDESLSRDLVAVAAEDSSDLGHKLIVTNAALRLVEVAGEKGRFATVRTAVWEIVSYDGERSRRADVDAAELLDALIARTVDVESAHGVFLFDAALSCRVLDRVAGTLRDLPPGKTLPEISPAPLRPYRLARDLGATLKAHAVAKRLRAKFPRARFDRFIASMQHNLEHGATLEEWSFA